MPPIAKPNVLTKSAFMNAPAKLAGQQTPAAREAANKLLGTMQTDGTVSVDAAYKALFPFAGSSKSASSQLSKLLKAIEAAGQASRCDIRVAYAGAKSKGAQARTFAFHAAPVTIAGSEIVSDLSATDNEPQVVEPRGVPMGAPDVLLMTFNDHEFRQTRERFWPHGQPPHRRPETSLPVDDLGDHGGLRVVHFHSEQGGRYTARNAAELLHQLAPRYVIAVGIAFGVGVSKQAIGDVLVSEFVVDYEHAKVHSDGTITLRGARPPASRRLQQELRHLHQNHRNSPAWPPLHFGGLLSGEKLVDNLSYRESLLRAAAQDDIVGGEMEAAGLAVALEGKAVEWIVIKAICDFADGMKGNDKQERQRHAANNAAQVVKALLDAGGLATGARRTRRVPAPPKSRRRPSAEPGSQGATEAHSQGDRAGGFDYAFDGEPLVLAANAPPNVGTPASLSTASRDRSDEADAGSAKGVEAVADIVAWLERADAQPLYAVLGEYGMGKTFTCQRVTNHINQRRKAGEALPQAIYLDLRKVTTAQAPDDKQNRRGHVPTLNEVITDCMRHGVLTGAGTTPTIDDVWQAIDGGAVVVFDGLDEVLNLLNEHQGQIFTGNLLRLHTEARQRAALQQGQSRTGQVRIVVSCRTQFFRSLLEQNQHLTGEFRGTHDEAAFRALLMLPFTDAQITRYLGAAFPQADVQALMDTIASVHNLREMAARPFTLKLIAKFLPRIERWRAQGRKVSGVTLYREVAQDWLLRDKNKQHFRVEDKLVLAADLAVHLWREGQRGISAKKLETWLGGWLKRQDPDAEFHGKPRELLQEDLRNATFLKRVDGKRAQDSRFQFAHTSLQEFLLADHLFRSLDDGRDTDALRDAWAMPLVSDETFGFFGQMLDEADAAAERLQRLGRLRQPYTQWVSEMLMRYGQLAYGHGRPAPSLVGIDLSGARLEGWHFGSRDEPPYLSPPAKPRLDLSGARFDGALLRRSRFWYMRLDGASLVDVLAAQAEWLDCSLADVGWRGAELAGTVVRPPMVASVSAAAAANASLMLGRGHVGGVNACAITPDSTRIVSASDDGTLRLWDAASGECLRVLQGHEGWVRGCAWTADGARIVSASGDGTLRLWDAASGECLRVVLAGARRAAASFDLTTGRIEHAEGSAWRHWAWQGFDEDGQPRVWPLDAMPGVQIKPWRWG